MNHAQMMVAMGEQRYKVYVEHNMAIHVELRPHYAHGWLDFCPVRIGLPNDPMEVVHWEFREDVVSFTLRGWDSATLDILYCAILVKHIHRMYIRFLQKRVTCIVRGFIGRNDCVLRRISKHRLFESRLLRMAVAYAWPMPKVGGVGVACKDCLPV